VAATLPEAHGRYLPIAPDATVPTESAVTDASRKHIVDPEIAHPICLRECARHAV